MKENVRKQWRVHLCCGRFRLTDYSGTTVQCAMILARWMMGGFSECDLSGHLCSDWSRSATVGDRVKKKNLVNSESVGSDDTCTTRKVSDSSEGSATNRHHQGAWGGHNFYNQRNTAKKLHFLQQAHVVFDLTQFTLKDLFRPTLNAFNVQLNNWCLVI